MSEGMPSSDVHCKMLKQQSDSAFSRWTTQRLKCSAGKQVPGCSEGQRGTVSQLQPVPNTSRLNGMHMGTITLSSVQ